MKKIIIFSSLFFLLFSCGKTEEEKTDELQDFFVSVQKLQTFSDEVSISQSAQVQGIQSATITTLIPGRVAEIFAYEGKQVKKWDILARLDDTSGSFKTALDSARVQLQSQKNTYTKTKIDLDKSVYDTQLAYESANYDYEQTVQNIEKQREQNAADLKKVSTDTNITQASLQVTQKEQQVEKTKFDFETLKISNIQTQENFTKSLTTYYETLVTFMQSTIVTIDKILGVTPIYRSDNDDFEQYLSARNKSLLNQAEQELKNIIEISKILPTQSYDIMTVNEIISIYDSIYTVLETMDEVLENTVTGTSLTATELDAFKTSINTLQTSYQSQKSSLVAFKNSVESFYATYKQEEESFEKNLEILENELALLRINTTSNYTDLKNTIDRQELTYKQQIFDAKQRVEQAQYNLSYIKNLRESNLKTLSNAISSAEISLQTAQINYDKLFVSAPITGTIGTVSLVVGQEIPAGTSVATISSSQVEMIFSVPLSIASNITIGDTVPVKYMNETYDASVVSISSVGNIYGLYPVRVRILEPVSYIGEFGEVEFHFSSSLPLLPINIIEMVSESEGEIYVYMNEQIEKIPVQFGKIWGEFVEITTPLDPETVIITSDVSRFDANEFSLVIQ